MGEITPPPVIVRMHKAPQVLSDGDEMAFSLWLLFFPVRWIACIEDVTEHGFVDRQVSGPFSSWKHKHTFLQRDQGHVEIRDEVHASLSAHPLWWLVGAGMWLSMPVLFAYRAWKTKRILER